MLDLGSILTRERPKIRRPRRKERERRPSMEKPGLSTAELAPCTCPEYCERDHDTD